MARHLEIWLNDMALREVSPLILIKNLHEKAVQARATFGDIAGLDGQRLIDNRRTAKTITVEFNIRELYDLGVRQQILDSVNRWATDGWLKSSSHPGQRIYVHATGWPSAENARTYTDSYTITFTTGASAYWEDEIPAVWAATGSTGSGTLANYGSAEALAFFTVESKSALTSLSVTVGDTQIALTGLSVPASTPVELWHDERGILRIEAGGVSLLSHRAPVSADELIAQPGVNEVAFEASASATVRIGVRGRYR